MEQYIIPSIILKKKFKDHSKFKKEVLTLIKNADDKDWTKKNDYFNDKLLKTDWPDADNPERPWIKLIKDSLQEDLTKCANYMGFQSIKLHKMWYQQYAYGDTHNWHTHDANYTGTYYLEFDEKCPTTEFLYPDNLLKSFTIDVEEGDILFFPCHLIHRSSVSKSNNIKSIISWNVDFGLINKEFLNDREKIEVLKK